MKPGTQKTTAATLLCIAAIVLSAGCGAMTSTEDSGAEAENERLREENAEMQEEMDDLQNQVEELGENQTATPAPEPEESVSNESESEESESETADTQTSDTESPDSEAPEAAEQDSGSGGQLAVAEPGSIGGDQLPEVMPDDFPLPEGSSASYVSSDETYFSMDILLDAEYEGLISFYEEQLTAQGWEQTDSTEGETEGLRWMETTWERGTFVPQGGDPNYEQVKENLILTVGDVAPAGAGATIYWNDYELSDRKYNEEEAAQEDPFA